MISPARIIKSLSDLAFICSVASIAACSIPYESSSSDLPSGMNLAGVGMSFDGQTIALEINSKPPRSSRIALYDRTTEALRLLPELPASHLVMPAFSPDGSRLVAIGQCAANCDPTWSGARLVELDLRDPAARWRTLLEHAGYLGEPSFTPAGTYLLMTRSEVFRRPGGALSAGGQKLVLVEIITGLVVWEQEHEFLYISNATLATDGLIRFTGTVPREPRLNQQVRALAKSFKHVSTNAFEVRVNLSTGTPRVGPIELSAISLRHEIDEVALASFARTRPRAVARLASRPGTDRQRVQSDFFVIDGAETRALDVRRTYSSAIDANGSWAALVAPSEGPRMLYLVELDSLTVTQVPIRERIGQLLTGTQ